MHLLIVSALSLSITSSALIQQPVPQINGGSTNRVYRTFYEVDRVLWPGCKISNEYPYEAVLAGFGTCSLQPCSCQEVRATSVVWGFAGKCDRAPGQIVDFVATMRLDRDYEGKVLKYPQNISTFPAHKVELEFAQSLRAEMGKRKYRNHLKIPAVEHVGIKLGEAGISLNSLRIGAGTQCEIYDESRFKALDEHGQKNLLAYGLPEQFFDSEQKTHVAMEVRGAFPVQTLFSRLGVRLAHRTVSSVLVSLGQSFQIYENAKWVHCDRSFQHVLFRKSILKRDMPGALIIDNDRVMTLANASSDLIILGRQHMLGWFAATVHNTCRASQPLPQPCSFCDPLNIVRARTCQFQGAREAYQRLEKVLELAEGDSDCKGWRFLANEVVGPALRCSAGEDGCPSHSIKYWAGKLQSWAVAYYGKPFQERNTLGPNLFNQE